MEDIYPHTGVRPASVRLAAAKASFFLREYFFPHGCALCGSALVGTVETWHGICSGCREDLESVPSIAAGSGCRTCSRCGRPLVSEQETCLNCRGRQQERQCDRIATIFPYSGRYRRLLAAYKFGRNIAVGNFFAGKMLELIASGVFPPEQEGGQIAVVPVPPRPGRIRETGWDQAGYLARLLEGKSTAAAPFCVNRCLRRLASQNQKMLGREGRAANLRGRIIPVRLCPQTAVIIDDVMTTGSTLDACAAALREGGAQRVYGLCLFYG